MGPSLSSFLAEDAFEFDQNFPRFGGMQAIGLRRLTTGQNPHEWRQFPHQLRQQ
jgi:hypothetical protein